VVIRPIRACAMHPASSFIMDVAMGRYHVPQNAFLVVTEVSFSIVACKTLLDISQCSVATHFLMCGGNL